jgi:hypothetical protein
MSGEHDGPVAADSVFTDHLVLYMDFLGVSEAAMSWPEEIGQLSIGQWCRHSAHRRQSWLATSEQTCERWA